MPTLPAAGYPTQQVPEVQPSISPPVGLERIQPTPEAFGAGIARATTQFGDVMAKAALEQQDFANKIRSDDAVNQYIDGAYKIMRGDPNNAGDTGYFGQQGEAAMHGYYDATQRMDKLLAQVRGGLQNQQQLLFFDQETRRQRAFMESQMAAHFDAQSKNYNTSVNKAKADLAANGIIANADDDAQYAQSTKNLMEANLQQVRNDHGPNPDQSLIDDALLKSRQTAAAARIEGLIPTNPARAQQVLDQERNILKGPLLDSLSQKLEAKGSQLLGDDMLRQAQGRVPLSSAPPLVPEQYRPMVERAAQDWGVPNELLTRVLDAENGFKPEGRSSAGAEGIAQFIPETAARYGVDVHDPASSIDGAAHYLSDLKRERGSWLGALTGYLGGDPRNDTSYNRAGATQMALQLDRGGAPAAAPAPVGVGAPPPGARGGGPLEVWGDSLGVGLQGQLKVAGQVHGGDNPTLILDNITAQPPDYWQGKTIVLPSGSNGNQMPVVEQTMQYLKDHGANVIAVGYGPKFPEKNAALQEIAQRQGVPIIAAEGVGAAEGVHPSPQGYSSMAGKITDLMQQGRGDQVIGAQTAAPAPALQQTAATGAAPIPTTPQVPSPSVPQLPGMAELSEAEAELARTHAATVEHLTNDPRGVDNPTALTHALQKADVEFRAKQIALTAQKQAITERRAATADQYTQKILSGVPDPAIIAQIATDTNLDAPTRENLARLAANPPGLTVAPAISKANAMQLLDRINKPWGDPSKITDINQLVQYATSNQINREDLTFLQSQFSNTRTGADAEIQDDKKRFIGGVKNQISKTPLMPTGFDQKGDERLFSFEQFVDQAIKGYRQLNKDPRDLFNDKKPDYLGRPEILKYYTRTMKDAMDDWTTNQLGGATAEATFGPARAPVDISKAQSLPDLQALVRTHPEDLELRQRAAAMALQKNWITPNPRAAAPIANPAAPSTP